MRFLRLETKSSAAGVASRGLVDYCFRI
jgi:hypothetical protein